MKKLDVHSLEVFRKSISSMAVKVSGILFTFLISIFLGRNLGPEGLGVINFAEKIVELLIIITLFGSTTYLIKKIAIYFEDNDHSRITNEIITSLLSNGTLSLLVVFIFFIIIKFCNFQIFKNEQTEYYITIFVFILIPKTLTQIFTSGLIGIRKIWQSSLTNKTLSSFFVLIGILFLFYLNDFSIINVSIVYVLSSFIVTLLIGIYWFTLIKPKLYSFNFDGIKFLKDSFPFMMLSALVVLSSNIDILMIGWLKSSYQVGIYSVSSKIALLSSFFLVVSNASLSPKLAYLYQQSKVKELELMVQNVTLILILLNIVITIIYVVFGKLILSLWGEEFVDSYFPLIFLSIGQFVNISTGCIGMIMMFTGFEKEISIFSALSLLINIVLNFFLINLFDVNGAAIATAISLIIYNILTYLFVKNRIGINTIPNYNVWKKIMKF